MVEISANDLPEITRIKIVDLRPGDLIVLLAPGRVSPETGERLKEIMQSHLPGQQCLVLGDGLDIEVVRKA